MTHQPPESQLDHDDALAESNLERLLAAGRRRFAEDGYAATSLDAVVTDAGVTRSTLHHHFESKVDLFGDVFEDEHAELARRTAEAAAAHDDPWEAAVAGLRAFLDALLDPAVQRITLVDAPGALGPQLMRELEAPYGLALVRHALERIRATGGLVDRETEPLAHLLFGAVGEAALYIARAEDQQAARDLMDGELSALLESLRR